jgi:hypothetical protein
MSKSTITTIVAVLALLVAGVALLAPGPAPVPTFQNQGVSNFDSIHLSDLPEGTATPVLIVNEQSGGSANVVEFRVAGTPTWYMNSSGNTTQTGTDTRSGNLDLNGNDLIIDADGDSVLDENTDDNIRLTLGAAAGTFSTLTGNLKVGNGSPTTSQDGEDAYVEGGLEVDGTARFDGAIDANSTADIAGNITSATGAITITDNVLIDGAADAEQLVVQGNATQTNNPFVVEQSDGTDVGTISNAGALDVASTVNYGSDDLYPLGYASSGYEYECGTTSTFTETTTVTASGLTTITVALATQITTPAATAAYLTATDPTTSTVDLNSWESDFTAGTTGITAHYCLIGNQ